MSFSLFTSPVCSLSKIHATNTSPTKSFFIALLHCPVTTPKFTPHGPFVMKPPFTSQRTLPAPRHSSMLIHCFPPTMISHLPNIIIVRHRLTVLLSLLITMFFRVRSEQTHQHTTTPHSLQQPRKHIPIEIMFFAKPNVSLLSTSPPLPCPPKLHLSAVRLFLFFQPTATPTTPTNVSQPPCR